MKNNRILAVTLILSFTLGIGEAYSQTQVSDQKLGEKSQAQTGDQKKKPAGLPSETPEKFEPTNYDFDYIKRDVMIPMRDGVKLHTVIITPKGARRAPILLTRTPYNATELTSHAQSSHLGPILTGYDNATDVIVGGGYIRAVQDVRGKYGSEGDYVMNRPLRGPLNPTQVDHATDTYEQVATRANETKWWTSHFDDYDMYMQAGSAGELGRRRGLEQVGFWRKLLEHPSYDAFWRDQAVDRILAAQPLQVPVMLVHSLWDQEDIYGDIAVYKAIKPKDANNDKVYLVLGPWHHGQEIQDGSTLGVLKFGSDTALYFRQEILRPFLDHYLKDDAPKMDVAPVTAYETGTNKWRRLPAWPAGCASGCQINPTPLYFNAGLKLSLAAPKSGDAAFEEYISDPAKPVPFRARPNRPTGYTNELTWWRWLVDDQREASGRPDVLAFVSDVLTTPLKISGQPIANLIASTSGTDSDWVVKVIDVYPDEFAGQPEMGGYQLMVSADIFRGRYRESLETAKPVEADKPLLYRFALPTANHVFLPGHRIMAQIQSSWFPLYDRNPQTFTPNIFWAKPENYRKATQRIYHAPGQASFVELPLVTTP